MFRKLLSYSGFTLLSRITGLVRDMMQAAILGAGPVSDAFVVAFLLPGYFRSIFAEGTINPAFVPRYTALRARGDDAGAVRFGNAVFSWQMAAQLAVLALAFIAMPAIVRLIAPGFAADPGEMALTAHLARITFPYLMLTVVAVQISAMLNAMEKFAASAAWSILPNLCFIATLTCSVWFPSAAEAAAWGVFIGGIAQALFMIAAARRAGIRLRIVWPRWTPEIAEFFKALGAVTLGASSVLIAPFIDNVLASFLAAGSRTALYYADRIDQLPLGVLGVAIGTVLLPEMSAKLALGDETGAGAAQNRAASLTLLLTLPFAAAFVAIPDVIMRGFFAHGHFSIADAALAATALRAYGCGLPAFALVRVAANSFYARHDTGTPARVTALAMACNIASKVVLVWALGFGLAGIALGTALGAWVNLGTLVLLGRRRGITRFDPAFWHALPPILIAAAITALGALAGGRLAGQFFGQHHGLGDLLVLLAAMVVAGLGYGAAVLLFRARLPLGRLAGRKAVSA